MVAMGAKQDQATSEVTAIIATALKQRKLSDLSEVLKNIAQTVDACGCILWEVAPVSKLTNDPPDGRLFVLAQGFQAEHTPMLYELPIYPSRTGGAALSSQTINIPDVKVDGMVHRDIFMEQMGITSMCIVPVTFKTDGNQGTLNVYRNCGRVFTEAEVRRIEEVAPLLPILYETFVDKVSSDLSHELNKILREAEIRAAKGLLDKDEMKEIMGSACRLIGETLQCFEASVFFEDRLEAPGLYSLAATTWPRPETFWKREYRKGDRGLTGWVLTKNEPVMIFDLANFDKDIEAIHSKYENLVWEDSLRIEQSVRDYFRLNEDDNLQPLSFMAVPIVMGEEVLGVLRCCTAVQGPYHFGECQLNLLKLAAAQLGQYWSNWLNRREMQRQIRSWVNLADRVDSLNHLVYAGLRLIENVGDERPPLGYRVYEKRIFEEALESISAVIGDANLILDIRLLEEESKRLYFAYVHGPAWGMGGEDEQEKRIEQRFPTDEEMPTSEGARVVKERKSCVVKNVADDRDGNFPGTTWMIVAPITVEDEIFGVIDVRSVGSRDFPEDAEVMANLIGQQLGLYLLLAKTMVKLEEGQKQQTRAFQDLGHQLKSPIIPAYKRLNKVINDDFKQLQSIFEAASRGKQSDQLLMAHKLRLNLTAVRGLFGKTRRVAASTGLFADLARGEPIKPEPALLNSDELVKMLIEAAMDNRVMTTHSRIRWHVKVPTFKVLDSISVTGDINLLEQAVNTVLDNAGKYSFEESKVEISAGVTEETEEFFILVRNKGIKILQQDIEFCVRRNWRSPAAENVTGEGSGIGLWIVNHIMKAQNGRLVIVPTTDEHLTDIKLTLPFKRR